MIFLDGVTFTGGYGVRTQGQEKLIHAESVKQWISYFRSALVVLYSPFMFLEDRIMMIKGYLTEVI